MAPREKLCSYRWLVTTGRLFFASCVLTGSSLVVSLAEDQADNSIVDGVKQLNPAEAAERIDALRAEIAYHDELYFKKSAPVISDSAYDQLKRELGALELAFPEAVESGIRPEVVGDDRVGTFPSYRHRVPMLSLSKGYSEAEIRAFDARLMKQLGRRDLDYVVEPKYDGLAISVTFEQGKLVRAVTRGNGVEGDDVTANVRTIRTLPERLRAMTSDGAANPMPDVIELRGEIYMTFAEFKRINRERESAGETQFSNPRNLAAGTLKQLDAGQVGERRLEIVFYGIGACEPAAIRPDSQLGLLRQFQAWGLPTINAPRPARGADAIGQAVQAVGRERTRFGFPIDGAVVKLNDVALQDQAGVTPQAPLWAIAYKFNAERVETQLRAITLQVGRTGVLTPVAELAPVKLGGTTVARASLHNADEITRRDIRVGDFVYVEKAGEIIPAISGVNRAKRRPEALAYVFPAVCPVCQSNLVRVAGEAAWRCPNSNCPAQVKRRVEHFASADCVAISGLGPAMVGKLVEKGWVRNVADLYRLRREDLLSLGGNVEKSTDRLLAAIERSKQAELWRFIHGLGIPHVGEATARSLAKHFGGLAELARATEADFFQAGRPVITGVRELSARTILIYFEQRENQSVVKGLLAAGVETPAAPKGSAKP